MVQILSGRFDDPSPTAVHHYRPTLGQSLTLVNTLKLHTTGDHGTNGHRRRIPPTPRVRVPPPPNGAWSFVSLPCRKPSYVPSPLFYFLMRYHFSPQSAGWVCPREWVSDWVSRYRISPYGYMHAHAWPAHLRAETRVANLRAHETHVPNARADCTKRSTTWPRGGSSRDHKM